ncbi:putative baseplate assembly protein [Streptomyces sp. NPDC092307]|uniref:putative baseplate assembly protein n=1 Tax=Streptomyces sp. NPDC092307 TaxID=3366013 RepID=UPI0037F28B4E
MSLPSPDLDDRRFQDLVDEAKRFIQRRCPEWTDHNVSDPGVALIEAFAQMVDQLSYRLNRIPDKVHLEFLDLLGVRLTAPQAARTELTFRLSARQNGPVHVPAGSEVATPRTGEAPARVFTVDRRLDIVPTEMLHIGSSHGGYPPELVTERFAAGEPLICFAQPPAPDDALLVGLDRAAPNCVVALRVDCSMEGVGVDPRRPPRVWEAWCGEQWVMCDIESDGTGGLNRPGEIVLHVPGGHTASSIGRRQAGWLRCRITTAGPDQPAYSSSPQVRSLDAYTLGGTTTAVEGERIPHDELGVSDGTPGQSFALHRTPAVAGSLREVLVETESGSERWTTVSSFADSHPGERHVTVDEVGGTVRFGPAVRQPDGEVRQFGAVPAIGSRVIAGPYRRGGGRQGNVAASTLTVLRTPITLVSRVENRRAATGGVDAESVDGVRGRAAHWLRTQDRAVTAGDYVAIAAAACREAGRIECVAEAAGADRAGLVRVLIVPQVQDPRAENAWRDLIPSEAMLTTVAQAVEAARPIGVQASVSGPAYQGVTVVAEVEAAKGADHHQVREQVLRALYAFLSPLPAPRDHGTVRDPHHSGWPLGRSLRLGDLYAIASRCPDVESVARMEMYPADLDTGERRPVAERIDIGATTLFLSFRHQVAVTSPR